ncbi:hypothetical protein AMS62_08735 [Bacillus sp. FJAT-18019]|nr:hypothetical protein AMS62_08735 [Bacillus sp. FJAT-18019]
MGIWSVLGIEPTGDIKLIRKAYAAMLKIHHPEDDPEGYQRLREAFDQAMKLAKEGNTPASILSEGMTSELDISGTSQIPMVMMKDIESDPDISGNNRIPIVVMEDITSGPDISGTNRIPIVVVEDMVPENEPEMAVSLYPPFPFSIEDMIHSSGREKSALELTGEFMEELNAIYKHLPSRVKISEWTKLLNTEAVWTIGNQDELSTKVLAYLNENWLLPGEIWLLLDSTFGWSMMYANEPEAFMELYPKIEEYVIRKSPLPPLYVAFFSIVSEQEPSFIKFHEAFASACARANGDYEEARHVLIEAESIFGQNDDFIWLKSNFYRHTDELDKALVACDLYMLKYPDRLESALLRARLLIQMHEETMALTELERISRTLPDHPNVLSLMGQCYMRLGRMDSAKEVYSRFPEHDIEAVVHMAKNHRYIKAKLPKADREERRKIKAAIKASRQAQPIADRFRFALGALFLGKNKLLLFFMLLLPISMVSYLNESGFHFKGFFFTPTTVVTKAQDLDHLPNGLNRIQINPVLFTFSGMVRVREEDDWYYYTSYMSLQDAEKKGLSDNITAYICSAEFVDGQNHEQNILFLDRESYERMSRNRAVELVGVVKQHESKELSYWSSKFTDFRQVTVTPMYFDTTQNTDLDPELIIILGSGLIMSYLLFSREIGRIRSYLRF